VDEELKEMKRTLGTILDRVTKIETVLEMRSDFDKRLRELEKDQAACRRHPVEEHERRIKGLELKQARTEGRASVLAAAISAGMSIAVSVIAGLIIWGVKG